MRNAYWFFPSLSRERNRKLLIFIVAWCLLSSFVMASEPGSPGREESPSGELRRFLVRPVRRFRRFGRSISFHTLQYPSTEALGWSDPRPEQSYLFRLRRLPPSRIIQGQPEWEDGNRRSLWSRAVGLFRPRSSSHDFTLPQEPLPVEPLKRSVSAPEGYAPSPSPICVSLPPFPNLAFDVGARFQAL